MAWHRRFAQAVIPVAAVLAATALCWYLEQLTGSRVPFIFFIPAVLLAAWYGGLLAGLTAVVAGYLLGDYVFLHTPGAASHHGQEEILFLLIYSLTTIGLVLLTASLRRSHVRLRARNEQLQQEMAERRAAERTLAEAEAKYRCLVEESLVGVYLIQDARFLYANARLAEIFGYAPGEVAGRPVGDLVADVDRETVMANVHKRENGEMQRIHYTFHGLRKDGQVIDVEVIGTTTVYQGRRAVLGTLLDMTERRRIEEAMRLSEERFRRVFDESPIGAAIVGPDRRYRQVNAMFCQMTGYSREEMETRRIEDITHPEDVAVDMDAVARMARGAIERFETDKRYIRKDGTVFWAHVSVRLLRDAAGRPLYFLPMVQDITARRTAEAQLREAKAAAEAANRAKDHFLAVLSHELRTPLSAVLPALETLKSLVPEEASEYVAMAQRNAELEARLIDDLLDVTRIARGKVVLEREQLDLCDIVHRAADVCHADIEARGLHFGIEIEHGPHWVEGDAGRLQQVFWNLIKNAVKFTPNNGCVGVRCSSAAGQAIVEVRDSGVGMEAEALDRVFKAFEQADRTVTRQFGGLGLGLAISKALVEMHGGRIRAHSDGKGKGSVFTVELPRVLRSAAGGGAALSHGREHEGGREYRNADAAAPPRPGALERPRRILMVEDHGDTAKVLRRLLTRAGHEVEHAGDVATALRLAGDELFDLIISDLGLPDRSGVELMQELRTKGCTIPGIALTGFGMEEDIRRTREAGFAEHLTKPVNVQHLLRVIEAVASRRP